MTELQQLYQFEVDPDEIYPNTGKHPLTGEPTPKLTSKQLELRKAALNNFEAFISLVAPYQLLGLCHKDLCGWVEKHYYDNKLILWPRDHGKSRMSAFFACWEICRNPAITEIYASATAEKAEEQLRFIKSILDSKTVDRYFPGLFHPDEGKRNAWNKTFIIVDHPHRANQGVVDATIMTAGLEKTITGKHCDRLLLDDIVVWENNTETGRKEVNGWVAQAASITSADSTIFAVGTRYDPNDAYNVMTSMTYDTQEGEFGEQKGEAKALFHVNQADVEADGEFLWPRQMRKDGRWFGFNWEILARKKAVYEANNEIVQFYAQYYNDPNDKSTAPIARDLFRYYSRKDLSYEYGLWYLNDRPVYMYAALDLAASTKNSGDFTVLIIGAIDDLGNRYVVHIDRLKTDKMSVIMDSILNGYNKYQFKKLRIESVAGFKLVAADLADRLHSKGIRIPVDLYVPPNTEAKLMRINSILEPLYQSYSVYHYKGGNCQVLEDELVSLKPLNDDTKDSWAMCCDLMELPVARQRRKHKSNVVFHPRYGGVVAV